MIVRVPLLAETILDTMSRDGVTNEYQHDREWAEEHDRKANPITLQMYDTIIQNTEKIFAFVTRPPIVFILPIFLFDSINRLHCIIDRC